jgi:hypothetical protein
MVQAGRRFYALSVTIMKIPRLRFEADFLKLCQQLSTRHMNRLTSGTIYAKMEWKVNLFVLILLKLLANVLLSP